MVNRMPHITQKTNVEVLAHFKIKYFQIYELNIGLPSNSDLNIPYINSWILELTLPQMVTLKDLKTIYVYKVLC